MDTILTNIASDPARTVTGEHTHVYLFDGFRFLPRSQSLWHGTQQVRLGSRAMAILTLLVQRRGELVSKADLVRTVWPSTFVEEVNLRVHVAAIRRALSDDRDAPRFIANVAGRGYCFIADVRSEGGGPPRVEGHSSVASGPETDCIDGLVDHRALGALVKRLVSNRLVSVVGIAGAGKSHLARAALAAVGRDFPAGTEVVEISGHAAFDGLDRLFAERADALATLPDQKGETARRSRALLLIDGCELAVGTIAAAIERLLHDNADLHVLATCTEALGAEGEDVFYYHGLTASTADGAISPNAPAMQVFLRAYGQRSPGKLSDQDFALATQIVERLGGNRRAIELAAANASRLGLSELLRRLEASKPTSPNISELSNWSFDALSPADAALLGDLSVFESGFTVDAACRVFCNAPTERAQLTEQLRGLLAKSLLISTQSGGTPRLYLARDIRGLARERLRASGRPGPVADAHARMVAELVAAAARDRRQLTLTAWVKTYRAWVQDVIAALTHLEAEAPAEVYADLATAALVFIVCGDAQRLLLDHARRALAALQSEPAAGEPQIARLLVSIVSIEQAVNGPSDSSIVHLERAARCNDETTRAAALVGLTWCAMLHNDLAAARDHASHALVSCEGTDREFHLAGKAAFAYAEHLNGNLAASEQSAMRILQQGKAPITAPGDATFLDRRLSMRILLARSLWITGKPVQAMQAATDALDFAMDLGSLALCMCLAHAVCPVLFWCGEDAAAAREVARLAQAAELTGSSFWMSWVEAYRLALRALEAKQGRANPVRWPAAQFNEVQRQLLSTIVSEPLGTSRAYASPFVAQAWCAPELIRLEGMRALMLGGEGASEQARSYYLRAVDMARRQGALAWELRAATSLAQASGRDEDHAALGATLRRFTEGHTTADLVVAQALVPHSAVA